MMRRSTCLHGTVIMIRLSIRNMHQSFGVLVPLLQRLDNNGRSTASTVADTSAANLALLLLEHTKKGGCDPGTRGAKGVTESHSTSVEIDLVFLNTEDLHVGQRNNAESLVDLESVNVGNVNLGVPQGLGHGQGGGGGELRGVLLSITPAKDLANGLEAVLLDSLLGSENKGSSAIREGRGVGGGDGTILLERRAESAGLGLIELYLVSD